MLDEADRLLFNHTKEIEKIISKLPNSNQRQTLLFSATLPANISSFFDSFPNKPFCYRQQSSNLLFLYLLLFNLF